MVHGGHVWFFSNHKTHSSEMCGCGCACVLCVCISSLFVYMYNNIIMVIVCCMRSVGVWVCVCVSGSHTLLDEYGACTDSKSIFSVFLARSNKSITC